MEQVFVPQVFTDTWYKGRDIAVKASSEDRNFLYENKAVSKVRIQMVNIYKFVLNFVQKSLIKAI